MTEPHLRAGDADRDRVAALLGEHMSAGRLTVEEYDDRVARAYAARTFGELADLTADLPVLGAVAHVSGRTPAPGAGTVHTWRASWAGWVSTALVLTGIWLMSSIGSGHVVPFWPAWVIGPWLLVGLAHRARAAAGVPVGRERHRGGRRGHC